MVPRTITICRAGGASGQSGLVDAFARALLANPRIFIMDEATSSIDTETEQLIQDALRVLTAGRTSIIIAHRLSAVRHAHRIIVMDKGKIVEAGSHDTLVSKPQALYAYLWRMQDGGQSNQAKAQGGAV